MLHDYKALKLNNLNTILQRPNQIGITGSVNIARDMYGQSIFIPYIPIQIVLLYIQKEIYNHLPGVVLAVKHLLAMQKARVRISSPGPLH